MGANERGVVIGNEAVFTDQPDGEPALLGMDLLRLALERAATAEEAVPGDGQPARIPRPGRRLQLRATRVHVPQQASSWPDPSGATVLETAGREWATETVRHGGRSISNGLTIDGFADAHAKKLRGRVAACAVRRQRTEASAASASGPSDLMIALRDHGPELSPEWSLLNGAMTGPCVHAGGLVVSTQTTSSWVADLRAPGAAQHWATATAAPCSSLFKPVAVDQPVDLGPEPSNRADDQSVWWRHERLHRLTMSNHATLLPRYRHDLDRGAGPVAGPTLLPARRRLPRPAGWNRPGTTTC